MPIHSPLHPGFLVKNALIDNTGLTVTDAAQRLGITRTTLSRLLNGHMSISPEMALRLSKFFGNSINIWINLQAQYDVWCIQQHANDVRVQPFDKAA
jgi:antitoxin HigA-1